MGTIGCNAVLGMSLNVSKDSSGERGALKNVSLTMMGTPCVLSRLSSRTMSGHPLASGPRPRQISVTSGGPPSPVYGGVEDVAFARVQSLARDCLGTTKEGE